MWDGGDWEFLGPKNITTQELGFVRDVYVPYANSNTIFAGSNTGGLWRTQNANDPTPIWECITDDPRMPAMGVTAMAADPNNPDIMYLASGLTTHVTYPYGSGVMKTTNANAANVSWTHVGNIPSNPYYGEVFLSLVTHPTQSGVVFVGGRNQIYKSTDGGATFTSFPVTTNTHPSNYVADIAFLPSNPNIMMISTQKVFHSDGGHAKIFVSSDAGETWTQIPVTHPSAPGKHPASITISTTPLDTAFYIHFGIDTTTVPASPNTVREIYPVYRMGYNGNFGNWTTIINNAQSNVNYFANEFNISPTNPDIMYFGKVQFYRKDYGATQTLGNQNAGVNNSTPHPDMRDVQIFSDGVNDIIYVATDGGVAKSNNNGSSWTDTNGDGPYITQFHDIGITSEKSDYIIGGAQDNNIFIFDGQTWFNDLYGDGMQSLVSWDTPNIVYSSANSALHRSTQGGVNNTFNSVYSGMILTNQFKLFQLRQDPNLPHQLYVSKNQHFKIIHDSAAIQGSSTSGVFVHKQISTDPNNNNIPIVYPISNIIIDTVTQDTTVIRDTLNWEFLDIQVAPSNNNILYTSISFNKRSDSIYQIQKLWMSEDAGDTWRAIGNFYFDVTRICINPENPYEIWVGFSSFSSTSRVFHCSNTNTTNPTFTNISTGLPIFSIQSLIYQKYSNGILYCGNDIGVYRYDPDSSKWVCFNKNLPASIVTDLEINYCTNELYASAYGRGVWKSPLEPTTPYELTYNHTIPAGRKEHHANDLIIKSGYTLTVNGILNMGKGTKIIVEVGAHLNVNGGTITNMCGEVWEGIEVWGSGVGQTMATQGYLTINDGQISYAKKAAQMYRSQGISGNGGVIQANNAIFKNNWNSVDFRPFQNFYYISGPLIGYHPNLSRFYNCEFIVDNDYREFDATQPFNGHMILAGVDGIGIYGCDFVNENTTALFQDAEDYGFGILSADADYRVGPRNFINPPAPADIGKFEGLFEGIRSMNISSNEAPVIERTDFVNNHYGIFNDGVNSLSVTRSNFTIGGFPKARAGSGNIHEGLVNNVGTGFTLEENNFSASSTNPTSALTVGMRVADTKANDNQIYLNSYDELFVANLANGENVGIGGVLGIPEPGLRYFCNDQNNSVFLDMSITQNAGQGLAGIAEQQHTYLPTSNLFISAANTFGDPVFDIWNGTFGINSPIDYRYWSNTPDEEPNPVEFVGVSFADGLKNVNLI